MRTVTPFQQHYTRLGIRPIYAVTNDEPAELSAGFWQLAMALIGLLCLCFLCIIVGIALYVPHGWMYLAIYLMGSITFAIVVHYTQLARKP